MSFPVPDLRDGLTVPARLILEELRELLSAGGGWYLKTDKPLRAVHEVDSTHPLPDLYAILLRIVRPWICRYPLLQNQGNVGSIDGDPPAGMRYNEMRFQPLGETLLPFDKDLGVVT